VAIVRSFVGVKNGVLPLLSSYARLAMASRSFPSAARSSESNPQELDYITVVPRGEVTGRGTLELTTEDTEEHREEVKVPTLARYSPPRRKRTPARMLIGNAG
jgi:hypothetical protein